MSRSWISTHQELRQGESLTSEDGNYKAIFQHDGNFVIYTWSPVWASNTYGQNPFRILLQSDSNLVMYNQEDKALWASDTHSNHDSSRLRLTMTNEGELVLDNNGRAIWRAGKK